MSRLFLAGIGGFALNQGSLFPELHLAAKVEDDPPLPAPTAEEDTAEPCSDQLLLFAPLTVHRAAIDRAIAEGDFAEAIRLRDLLSLEHGAEAVPVDLSCLESLAACRWDPPDLPELLAGWHTATEIVVVDPNLRRRLTRGFLTRLTLRIEPPEIARQDASCVPDLVHFLFDSGQMGVSLDLVRDALLRGENLDPDAFDEARTRDLLAEDFSSRWLACLGALRGVWQVPRSDDLALAALADAVERPLPDSDADRALAFWDCLRVTVMKLQIPETLLHQARRRMKALHPEFHHLYMNRGC